jgi:tetratricopeptide (TPR) repeat protein
MDLGLPGVAADVLDEALNVADSDVSRRELMVASISALGMAGQWHRLTERLGDYRRVQEGLDPVAIPHDNFEFLEMEAMLRTRCDLSQLLARATSCVESRNASAEHRLRALVLGLMFADNLFDAGSAARLFAYLDTIDSSGPSLEAHRIHAELIYHSTFGDIDAALRCTDKWLSQERGSGDPARICRALRNAAIPYRIGGLLDKAFACLVESFELASRHQMYSHAANTGDVLATLNLHCGDIDNAKRWCDTALAWARKTEENAVQVSIDRVKARISLFEGDFARARDLLRAHPDQGGDDTILRRSVDGLAADVLLAAAENAHEKVLTAVPKLLTLFEKAQRYYGQDFNASAVATGLHYLGQRADADRLLRRYTLYSRRERAPLSAELKRALTLL